MEITILLCAISILIKEKSKWQNIRSYLPNIWKATGEVVPNIAERKAEFVTLHNELRILKGLEPRSYNF